MISKERILKTLNNGLATSKEMDSGFVYISVGEAKAVKAILEELMKPAPDDVQKILNGLNQTKMLYLQDSNAYVAISEAAKFIVQQQRNLAQVAEKYDICFEELVNVKQQLKEMKQNAAALASMENNNNITADNSSDNS